MNLRRAAIAPRDVIISRLSLFRVHHRLDLACCDLSPLPNCPRLLAIKPSVLCFVKSKLLQQTQFAPPNRWHSTEFQINTQVAKQYLN